VEYSVIFKDLLLKSGKYLQGYDEKMMPVLIEEMQKDPQLNGFNVEELKTILFQIGLSIMAANGLLPKDCSKQDMMDILSSTADDVIISAKLRRGL
jgi:imidazole glycerol phosphate synthase subunit HisF